MGGSSGITDWRRGNGCPSATFADRPLTHNSTCRPGRPWVSASVRGWDEHDAYETEWRSPVGMVARRAVEHISFMVDPAAQDTGIGTALGLHCREAQNDGHRAIKSRILA